MVVVRTEQDLRAAVAGARQQGKTVGFFPTMGALHGGHLSLMQAARADTDFVVVSIFVNPTQFAPTEDLDRYPRCLDRDAELAESVGVDLIFAPSTEAMYPPDASTHITEDALARVLEGEHRPSHFGGVCTICAKLFNLVQADAAYFGQKDFQQALIIRRMVRDLNIPLEVRVMPIVREPDGLAMSSRNAYLTPEQRTQALCLSRALGRAKELFAQGERDAGTLRRAMEETIQREALARIDYVAIADAESLEPLDQIGAPAAALLAVRIGDVRLIDNALLTPES